MAYDEGLAQRIRETLDGHPGLIEKKMFGGVGYMLFGNMACGVINDDLIVRVGPDAYEDALQQPGARVFDMTGRPMKGWVVVMPEALTEDDELEAWIAKGTAFALSLPVK